MADADRMLADEFVAALSVTASVLEDHAGALDRLSGSDAGIVDPSPGRPGVGTEMAVVVVGAVAEAAGATDFSTACTGLCRGAREAANSVVGRLLERVFRGFSEVLANADELDATKFALALEAAAEQVSPTDDGKHAGGFRAVLAESADGALSATDRGGSLGETIVAAADAGLEELERGPQVNADLAARGVVDASAAGLLLMLDALAAVVNGTVVPSAPDEGFDLDEVDAVEMRVACQLRLSDPTVAESVLPEELEQLGQLNRFTRTNGTDGSHMISLDLRTLDAGVAVESLIEFGSISGLRITVAEPSPRFDADNNPGRRADDRSGVGSDGVETLNLESAGVQNTQLDPGSTRI